MSSSAIPRGQVDLVDFVDWSGVECLNQTGNHPIANTLKQGYRDDDGLHLESDADEQLLIYIPFTQVVKLHSAVITGPEEEGPRTVKLFANKEHMGFSNVNDYPPSDSLSLSPEDLKGKPVTLKYVKFQNVRSLTIFIEDNHGGGDISKVQKILLYGTTVDTTNMKDLKKIEDH
ncbi:PITH domain-containing protein At3g04780-like [Zingiber officinale]|uniref:PITH domain-containing protein At3g04780-like n=1 Tax=Zingiber officinale TaxID=94328 RepID=UPI001C4B2AC4|nr:PITH domain-containing protein At3g04780-like [Zingiber officinale]